MLVCGQTPMRTCRRFAADREIVRVPASFIAMDDGDGFKFEIVVREASGNQTVFESCFKVKE